jgi:hypothetical protein
MANELKLNITVTHEKSPKVGWRPVDVIQATQTGTGVFSNVFDIATAGENISFGDLTPGPFLLINLSDTNFVDWGLDDGGTIKAPCRLYAVTRWPGMGWLKPGATLRLQADTNPCQVLVLAWQL